jgi:carbon-monoxide dehydrogenase large subunit
LATGRASFLADLDLPAGTLEVAFVRSPFPRARIGAITGAHASGHDLGLRPLTIDGTGLLPRPWLALPTDLARYVGEPVAMVWASDRYLAEDLADQVEVDWEALELEPPTPLFEASVSNGDVDELFASASHIVERTFRAARQTPLPMEPRGVLARPLPDGRLELWTSTQVPHLVRRDVAAALGVSDDRIRVLVPHVGGGFGLKAHVFAEELALSAAALRSGHPLRWIEDRVENLVSSAHAHDTEVRLRVAVDRDGRLRAVDATVTADVGAYSIRPFGASLEPMTCASTLFGPYAIDAIRFRALGLASNKCPVGAYRGVGMDAAVYATERMVDEIAVELAIDPLELRRRNAIAAFPAVTMTGRALDSGDYAHLLEQLEQRSDYQALRAEQQTARAAGRLMGIGIGFFNEHSGTGSTDYRRRGVTAVPGLDAARVVVGADGRLTIFTSAAEAGQGHAAAYRAIAVSELGIRPEAVDVVEGDTDLAPFGSGTFASRGAVGVVDAVVLCLREAAAQDLVPGTDVTRTVDPAQVFPSGAHLAVVEIDAVSLVPVVTHYFAVEDAGTPLHQAGFDGQVRGGIAMGLGGVLHEEVVYASDGQILTATLLDYLVPLAPDVPTLALSHLISPSPRTALGSKGVGEGGTIGAFGAVANAVADAVRPLGAALGRLPYSPDRIFTAIEHARTAGQGPAGDSDRGRRPPASRPD